MVSAQNYTDTVVVIPAFDEESSVAAVVKNIRHEFGLPVIVVNDKSSDNTCSEASAAGATVLNLCCQLGAWGATQAGLRYALKKGYKRCVTCDADGQHDIFSISRLLDASIKNDTDIVIGSCISRGSRSRHLAWKYFRFLTGLNIDDLTSGFRVYNYYAMQKVALSRASLFDYQDVSVLLLLNGFGMTFKEVEVCMVDRSDGKSRIFHSWLAVAKYMMLTSIIALCRMSK